MKNLKLAITDLIIGMINIVFSLSILGLFIRFFFRLLGANPNAGVVEFIYESTTPLLAPFRGIFQPAVIEPGNVLEFSTLIAIVFYMLLAWILGELVMLFAAYTKKGRNIKQT
jgi:uncharacterized protein YggT (Ycf19 family)